MRNMKSLIVKECNFNEEKTEKMQKKNRFEISAEEKQVSKLFPSPLP